MCFESLTFFTNVEWLGTQKTDNKIIHIHQRTPNDTRKKGKGKPSKKKYLMLSIESVHKKLIRIYTSHFSYRAISFVVGLQLFWEFYFIIIM